MKAEVRSPCKIYMTDRVLPHEGHGIPVIPLNKQTPGPSTPLDDCNPKLIPNQAYPAKMAVKKSV
jgi:hypothetical protein